MSTIFDYANPMIETMPKEILFALVKREGNHELMMSPRAVAYKNATLEAINGCTVEYITECMHDIRGDDAVCEEFYDLSIEFYIKGLIDQEKFLAILQPITKLNVASSTVEHKRELSITRFPRVYEDEGLKVMDLLIREKYLPENPREIIKMIIKHGLNNSYEKLFKMHYGETVEDVRTEIKRELNKRFKFDTDFE